MFDYATQRAIAAPDEAWLELRIEQLRMLRADATPEGIRTRLLARLRRDHILTPVPCRLPSGDRGRTAIKRANGEWTAVCVPA